MWNTTNVDNQSSTHFNTPATGMIQKSNKNSYLLRMHANSKLKDELFKRDPMHDNESVTVLQVLLIDEGYWLVEIVPSDKL